METIKPKTWPLLALHKLTQEYAQSHHDWLRIALEQVAEQSERPLVIFFDEVDALVGDSLISFLRQLRAGYNSRPSHFPASVILCGVRDLKDYRMQMDGKDVITGGSAFNIKVESCGPLKRLLATTRHLL